MNGPAWSARTARRTGRPRGHDVNSPRGFRVQQQLERGHEGGHLTDAQFERLKQELEENFSGAFNAGRPLLLEGGLDWKALSLSPKDMDFSETKASAAREIVLAFGAPPLLIGLPGDNTFRNYEKANRAFWRQTIIPLVQRLQKAFPRARRRAGGG